MGWTTSRILNIMMTSSLWPRFQQYFLRYNDLGFSLDISRMRFPGDEPGAEKFSRAK